MKGWCCKESPVGRTSDYIPSLVVGQRVIVAAGGGDFSNVTQSLVQRGKVDVSGCKENRDYHTKQLHLLDVILFDQPTTPSLLCLSSVPLLCKAEWERSHILGCCWSFRSRRRHAPGPCTAWLFFPQKTPPWISPMEAWRHTALRKNSRMSQLNEYPHHQWLY